jgi:hypothetical protein
MQASAKANVNNSHEDRLMAWTLFFFFFYFRHIREDLGDWVSKVDTQKMTPEELEFHYFK